MYFLTMFDVINLLIFGIFFIIFSAPGYEKAMRERSNRGWVSCLMASRLVSTFIKRVNV